MVRERVMKKCEETEARGEKLSEFENSLDGRRFFAENTFIFGENLTAVIQPKPWLIDHVQFHN